MSAPLIPHPSNSPHITPTEAAAIYGLSKPTVYEQCSEYLRTNGATGIPCLRLGHKILVITAKVWEQFGLTPAAPVPTSGPGCHPTGEPVHRDGRRRRFAVRSCRYHTSGRRAER